MFIPYLRTVFSTGLLLVLALGYGPSVYAQQTGQPVSFEESFREFEAGHYRTALNGFLEMKESQPGKVMNYYYAGRCLVELNQDLDDAIEYLYSASKRGAPVDAIFYLGLAYHRDYNFSEAKKYYSRFRMEGSKQEVKALRVNHLINTCRSALQITAEYNQYEVMTVTFLDLTDSVSYSQIRMKGGQLQRKPMEYFRQAEEKTGLSSLMFMPAAPLRGDYIFYSGKGRSGKGGLQLYRVKKGSGRSWGDPQEIKTLSTEGDELLPYYDPIENDLYYASDGGEGVGGFDLYRAHYDPVRDEWTEPINLGFPINSAMDDYLLLPGTDLGMMMFFSNRQGTDSTLTVYRVHLVEPKLQTDANDNGKLKEVANLGGVADEILTEISAMSEPDVHEDLPLVKQPEKVKTESTRVVTPVIIVSGEETPAIASQSNVFLAEALVHQAVSDSLKDLAIEARARVRESDDPNDRWVWQKQILVWEKKAHDEEELADAFYSMMEKTSPDPVPTSTVQGPESIESQQPVIAPAVVEGEPGTQPFAKLSPREVSVGYINRFDILGASPYSESNPIPTDVALPDGVFYRIQLGVFGEPVNPGTFKGISPLTADNIKERGLIKYYAGKFTKYDDASIALSKIRSNGYEDAFLAAWYDGSPISTQKAKQLE